MHSMDRLNKDILGIIGKYVHQSKYSIVIADLVTKCYNVSWRLDDNCLIDHDVIWMCKVDGCGYWRWRTRMYMKYDTIVDCTNPKCKNHQAYYHNLIG